MSAGNAAGLPEFPKTKSVLRYFQDFPKKGICFVDVNPIMSSPEALDELVTFMTQRYRDQKLDAVCALESRGYYFGIPLARELHIPFVPIRKPGKLPGKVVSVEYGKEYGKDILQMQESALARGARVVIIDDLLATGGSMNGAIKLVRDNFDAKVVETLCVIELPNLHGRDTLPKDVPFIALVPDFCE